MSTPCDDRRSLWDGLLWTVVLLCILWSPPSLSAAGDIRQRGRLARRANAKIAEGRLLEAEKLYRRALETADDFVRPNCLDGLVSSTSTSAGMTWPSSTPSPISRSCARITIWSAGEK